MMSTPRISNRFMKDPSKVRLQFLNVQGEVQQALLGKAQGNGWILETLF